VRSKIASRRNLKDGRGSQFRTPSEIDRARAGRGRGKTISPPKGHCFSREEATGPHGKKASKKVPPRELSKEGRQRKNPQFVGILKVFLVHQPAAALQPI
jgi:hypothetical protein